MAQLSGFLTTYRTERAQVHRTPRTPVLTRLAKLVARALPSWTAFRTTALSITGFGCLTAAAWLVALPLGLVAIGISALLIEYLITSDSR